MSRRTSSKERWVQPGDIYLATVQGGTAEAVRKLVVKERFQKALGEIKGEVSNAEGYALASAVQESVYNPPIPRGQRRAMNRYMERPYNRKFKPANNSLGVLNLATTK